MAFGRRKRHDDETNDETNDDKRATVARHAAQVETVASDDEPEGPFDIEDFDDPSQALQLRHDLGSVLMPVEDAAELAVEVNPQGVPTMVWMMTPHGRYNLTAYAA